LLLFGRKTGKAIDQLGLTTANLLGMIVEQELDVLIGKPRFLVVGGLDG